MNNINNNLNLTASELMEVHQALCFAKSKQAISTPPWKRRVLESALAKAEAALQAFRAEVKID